MQQQRLSLDELELSSFVTSLPAEEQQAMAGACAWYISWTTGIIYDAAKALVQSYAESTSGMGTTTETSAGFFDTSYPCG
jgi:hypothetical protein